MPTIYWYNFLFYAYLGGFFLFDVFSKLVFSILGMAQFVSQFAEPGDPEYARPVQEAETPVSFHFSEDSTSLKLLPI